MTEWEHAMARNQRDISFATFNLLNLQLPDAAMYPGGKLYSEQEYQNKIAWTAAALRLLDADVIAFQELWSAPALHAAFEKAELGNRYRLVFIKEPNWDGIAVAAAVREPWQILSKKRHKAFPEGFFLKKRKRSMAGLQADPPEADLEAPEEDPETVPSHEDEEIKVKISEFSRSVLQVTIGHSKASDVPPIEVFCTHLKSKLGTRLDNAEFRNPKIHPHRVALGAALSTIRRTAEATALRIILNETMVGTDTPVAVLGDLNDGPLSNTLNVLTDQPSYRLRADSWTARANDDGLYSSVTLQQFASLSNTLYTHEFKHTREVIDHCLVLEQFYDHSDQRRWSFREMKIWNDFIDDKFEASSDHGIVRATFDWNPAAAPGA